MTISYFNVHMSEIRHLAMKVPQNVKSLKQLSSGERFISPLQLDNNKWSLALYQLTKSGEAFYLAPGVMKFLTRRVFGMSDGNENA